MPTCGSDPRTSEWRQADPRRSDPPSPHPGTRATACCRPPACRRTRRRQRRTSSLRCGRSTLTAPRPATCSQDDNELEKRAVEGHLDMAVPHQKIKWVVHGLQIRRIPAAPAAAPPASSGHSRRHPDQRPPTTHGCVEPLLRVYLLLSDTGTRPAKSGGHVLSSIATAAAPFRMLQ